jgi:hypothetical protein
MRCAGQRCERRATMRVLQGNLEVVVCDDHARLVAKQLRLDIGSLPFMPDHPAKRLEKAMPTGGDGRSNDCSPHSHAPGPLR